MHACGAGFRRVSHRVACVLADARRDERGFLRGFSDLTLKNWNGIEVGALRASPGLRSALG